MAWNSGSKYTATLALYPLLIRGTPNDHSTFFTWVSVLQVSISWPLLMCRCLHIRQHLFALLTWLNPPHMEGTLEMSAWWILSLLVPELLKSKAGSLSIFGSNLIDRNGYPISSCWALWVDLISRPHERLLQNGKWGDSFSRMVVYTLMVAAALLFFPLW